MSVLRSKRTITSISFHYMALLTLTDREQSIHTKVQLVKPEFPNTAV